MRNQRETRLGRPRVLRLHPGFTTIIWLSMTTAAVQQTNEDVVCTGRSVNSPYTL